MTRKTSLILLNLTIMLVALLPLRVSGKSESLTLRSLFCDMQVSALELLSADTRLDMLDYAEAGKEYSALNSMYGHSQITQFSDSCMHVRLSEVSEAELFLLPSKGKPLAALIYTLNAGGADSQLFFYGSDLTQLKTSKYFTAPAVKDFISTQWQGDKQVRMAVEQAVPFEALCYSYDAQSHVLTATLSLKAIVTGEEYEGVEKYLNSAGQGLPPTLKYRWDGSRFRLIKN